MAAPGWTMYFTLAQLTSKLNVIMEKKGNFMASTRFAAVLIVSVLASSLYAGPKIDFDTRTFKCGEVIEGKVERLNAVFNIKNTGNADLKLTNVRPGCGCTVVKYDTTIKPGKTAKIEADVNIKGYHASTISKSITVTSNAENDSVVRLSIEATIVAVIDVPEVNLTLGGNDTAATKAIKLASKMKGLRVSEVFFRADENPNQNQSAQDALEWKKELPLPFKYTWTAADSARLDGFYPFALNISVPKFSASENGNLIIKTNHPDKPEISIRTGIIQTQTPEKKK